MAAKRTKQQSYLEVVGTGERMPVPDDPDGERAAVAAHPAFKRRVVAARRASREGRTMPFAEARRLLDAEEKAERAKPTGKRPRTAYGRVLLRLPLSVHQELIERAAREQTSLNQLALAYISRGLGKSADTDVA